MRIHTDNLTAEHIRGAARIARVTLDRFTTHGSKSRARAFDITLQGESRRHQNGGEGKAATWDQWGVFLGILFDRDHDLSIPTAYSDGSDFHYKTGHRFDPENPDNRAAFNEFWPADAHGDHRFKFTGTPYSQNCTKCSAVTRWQ